jgi:predicted dehydrogenase
LKRTFHLGVVGCGDISSVYLEQLRKFPFLTLAALADLVPDRAKKQAKRYKVERVLTPEALLSDPNIDIVLNLTPPAAHGDVGLAALEGGKHLYSEKPLCLDRTQGKELIDRAKEKHLRIGCAPDTFMGAGIQTAIQLLDAGALGDPIAAGAFMACHGHEHWHPDPDFYYQPGGGPLFDMGPYYLTALCAALGPVKQVWGSTQISQRERGVQSGPYAGRRIPVNTPTHVSATLHFTSGLCATLMMSFDVWAHNLPLLEIYGTKGSLSLPDPNTFGGPIRLRGPSEEVWREVPLRRPYGENNRGLGLADMARALISGRPHRASGDLAFHVLDVMDSVYDAHRTGQRIEVTSTMERPAPLRSDLPEGTLES